MKQPIVEGDDTINLTVGSHITTMVFCGRDGIYKTAIFHPITSHVDGLIEIMDSTLYRNVKPNQVTFIYSTVQHDEENPLTPNGIIVAELHKPFWDIIETLLGEQFESLTDLQAINATSKMLANLAQEVKSTDPSITIFEKQQEKVGEITN